MDFSQFPFVTATVAALVVHILCVIVAACLEPVWNGDSPAIQVSALAQTARVFTVKRTDVRRSVTWGFILASRVALAVSALSLGLELLTG